jgi:hypothetical protein
MAFLSVTGSVHWYPAAVQLLDSLCAQLQLKLSDQEEQLIFAASSQHGGGGGSCGDVAVCSVFNLTATPSDHQSQWIADQQLLVSAAKIVCNSDDGGGETTITKVVVDLEAAAAAAQQQETMEPTGRNFGCTADFFYEKWRTLLPLKTNGFLHVYPYYRQPFRNGLVLRIRIVLVPV